MIEAIWIWIVLGAIGGFLHWILPYGEEKPDDIIELVKRIVAGAILVPLVMLGGTSIIPPQYWVGGYFGCVILGYFAIDILKAIIQGIRAS